MTNLNNQLENVCKYLQANDRNGEFLDLFNEYTNGELEFEVLTDILINTLTTIQNEDLAPNDTEGYNEIQTLINSIN